MQRFDTFVFIFFYHTQNCDLASVDREMQTQIKIGPANRLFFTPWQIHLL